MTTDFRALCARMADELDHYRQLLMDDRREVHSLATEARTALRQSHIRDLIDQAFTPSEQEAILVVMADAVGDGRKYEIYREPRNGKNVLMVRVHNSGKS